MKALQEEQFLGMYLAYYQTIFFAGKKTAAEHHWMKRCCENFLPTRQSLLNFNSHFSQFSVLCFPSFVTMLLLLVNLFATWLLGWVTCYGGDFVLNSWNIHTVRYPSSSKCPHYLSVNSNFVYMKIGGSESNFAFFPPFLSKPLAPSRKSNVTGDTESLKHKNK